MLLIFLPKALTFILLFIKQEENRARNWNLLISDWSTCSYDLLVSENFFRKWGGLLHFVEIITAKTS